MSEISKKLFEKNPKKWLEGFSSLDECNKNLYGEEGILHGYFLILNPDTGDKFDNRLNELEMDYGMCSIGVEFIRESIGFNKNGESVRVGMFTSESHSPDGSINSDKIKELLGDVLYDLYKFQ
jgi:hypothetical protein